MNKEKKDAIYVSMTAQDMEHLENVRKYYEEFLNKKEPDWLKK